MFDYESEEDRSFIQRHRVLIFIGLALLIGVGILLAAKELTKRNQNPIRNDEFTMVRLPPPPPPPKPQPTPPPQQQPTPEQQQDQKMMVQQPVQDEKKSEAPKDKPPDAPAPLGTSITGAGGGQDLGLSRGLGGGGGYGAGGLGGGSKYGWYASEVQNRIRDALTSNPHTRYASINVIARVWLDSTGRVIKAQVSGGDSPDIDAAIEKDVLDGLQLADAPPPDMPLPIVMRIGLRRP